MAEKTDDNFEKNKQSSTKGTEVGFKGLPRIYKSAHLGRGP